MRFRTTIQSAGKTATGIRVPPEVVGSLGAGKRPAVRVTMRGHTYRSTIAPRGDRYLLGVSAENRALAGVGAGDEVDVDLELDTEPREVEVPADLAETLAGDAQAAAFFDGLSYSQKRWYVEPIAQAKTPETRQRRVAKGLAMLRERRKRRRPQSTASLTDIRAPMSARMSLSAPVRWSDP